MKSMELFAKLSKIKYRKPSPFKMILEYYRMDLISCAYFCIFLTPIYYEQERKTAYDVYQMNGIGEF